MSGKMNVKKTLLLLVVAAVLMLTACTNESASQKNTGTNSKTTKTETEKETKIEKNIDSVAETLGLTGGTETLYSFIGATAGKEYNNGDVELYQFDTKSDAYKLIIGNDSPLSVSAYKDGIVLIFPAGTEEDKDLIKKFNNIKFK